MTGPSPQLPEPPRPDPCPPEATPSTVGEWAELHPGRPAVVDQGDGPGSEVTLTYGDWEDRANRLASSLHDAGLRAGDRVGVRTRIRHEWFVIRRALGKLDVAHVAINWRLTPPEAAYIVGDAGLAGVFLDDPDPGPALDGWKGLGLSFVATVGGAGPDAAEALPSYEQMTRTGRPEPRSGPETTRTPVVYTSGTTGRPKGVASADRVRGDRAVLDAYLADVRSKPPTPPGSRSLLTLPLHHAAGPLAAGQTHTAGGTVHTLDPFDAETALAIISSHRITHWAAVPTMLARVVALPEAVRARYDLSSIRALTTGAAPVPGALKERLRGCFPPDVLWENYGATELGMVTYLDPDAARTRPASSGLPYAGVELRIVDARWNPLPPGTTGELVAKTPTVISRYLGRAPLGEDELRDGFLRTGDVGHLDADGYLYITDRARDMIVAGGVNIYPAEIEAVLVAHPDVVEAAVIGIPEEVFGEQPVAFVERAAGSALTAEALIAFTSGHLAPYKRPRRVEFVDALPRNDGGKVLKRELRAPYWQGRERGV